MKHKKPIIGITMALDKAGFIREGIDYNYIRREYGKEVSAAGGQPIFLDNNIDAEAAAALCDGIVISGGHDIDPAFYGTTKVGDGTLEPSERTVWERALIVACDRADKHILGVCYGHQLLNVHYGGTLYQDIAAELPSPLAHGASAGASTHDVTFSQEFLQFAPEQIVQVASRHHQAVRDIAPGFTVIATAPDGVVEAITNGRHYGIQWHAESDGTAPQLYRAFVSLCGQSAAAQRKQVLVGDA